MTKQERLLLSKCKRNVRMKYPNAKAYRINGEWRVNPGAITGHIGVGDTELKAWMDAEIYAVGNSKD